MIFEKIEDLITSVKFEGIHYVRDRDPSESESMHPFNPFPDGSLLFDVIVIIQLCFMFVGYYHVIAYMVNRCLDCYEHLTGKEI